MADANPLVPSQVGQQPTQDSIPRGAVLRLAADARLNRVATPHKSQIVGLPGAVAL